MQSTWYELRVYSNRNCAGNPSDVRFYDTEKEANEALDFDKPFYDQEGYSYKIVKVTGEVLWHR